MVVLLRRERQHTVSVYVHTYTLPISAALEEE